MGRDKAASGVREVGSIVDAIAATLLEATAARELPAVLLECVIAALEGHAALLISRHEQTVTIVGAVGYPRDLVDANRIVGVDAPLPSCHVIRTGTELWIASPEEYDAAFPTYRAAAAGVTKSAACVFVPVFEQRRVIGALGVEFSAPRPADGTARALLRRLAELFARDHGFRRTA